MSDPTAPPSLGFIAESGTGKTTLLSRVIPILNERGFKFRLVKHNSHHDFETDQPGRLRKADPSPVLLMSK